jgi:hypothetical protein
VRLRAAGEGFGTSDVRVAAVGMIAEYMRNRCSDCRERENEDLDICQESESSKKALRLTARERMIVSFSRTFVVCKHRVVREGVYVV